jgi:hypothetical protein
MVKLGPVLIGFILAVLVKTFMGPWELIGLLVVGFLVGYMAKEGVGGGLVNAAVAGALGSIIGAIALMLFGILLGPAGIVIFGITGIAAIVVYFIYYAIIMGIAGAIGGALAGEEDYF